MSGIFGLIAIDGRPLAPGAAEPLRAALAAWGPDGAGVWAEGAAVLGQALRIDTPESAGERMPAWHAESRVAFTAQGRLDNRDDLFEALRVPSSERPAMPDGDLMWRAYLRWGEDTPPRLLGDWSFAAWHPAFRRLVLARDHHGVTALYVWRDAVTLAFASSLGALLALPGVPARVDELRLAQIIVSWPGDGVRTAWEGIEALPPAHLLVVAPGREERRRYWFPEATRVIRGRTSADCAEGLREVIETAVRVRLRSHRPVAAMLSGGLDSGSVAALAARELGARGARLRAYCAVPAFPDRVVVSASRFGDESGRAQATATHAGHIDLVRLAAAEVSPLDGVRRGLGLLRAPQHAASNLFWILDLVEAACAGGAGVLLMGQSGNATISWKGRPWVRPGLAAEDARRWLRRLAHGVVVPCVPAALFAWRARRRARRPSWDGTAINPDFARRLRIAERWADEDAAERRLSIQLRSNARRQRLAVLDPGRSPVGAFWAEVAGALGVSVRDPTADVRVVEYALGVPNREYTGPGSADRWLIRRAMRGVLPPVVIDSAQRGLQAADVVARLAAAGAREGVGGGEGVHEALDTLARDSRAGQYVDVARLRAAWALAQAAPTAPTSYRASVCLIVRGIMAGQFVARSGQRGI